MKTPRILVVRGGAIGDFLMTLPAIGALRERWPDAHIEILGYPHIIELARGRYYADAVRSIEARAMAGFFAPNNILDPGLMDYFGGFNLVISYLFDPDSLFANNIRRCGVRQVIEASPKPREHHAAEHYCAPLGSLGTKGVDPGQLYEPRGLAMMANGDLVVANAGLNRLDRFGVGVSLPTCAGDADCDGYA